MANKTIFTDEANFKELYRVKSANPMHDDRAGVWTPDVSTTKQDARGTKLVPSVFAGVSARMQAMGDLPFTIYAVKGDKELDTSDNYKNVIGFLPYPSRTFALTDGSLVNAGKAYWYKGQGEKTKQTKELRYWIPSSVTLDAKNAQNSIIKFQRQGVPELYDAEKVLYTWLLDSDVELGPPLSWPLESALIAAQANGAITKWVADYMKRGAIKAMFLMMDGMPPPGEVDKIENWFNRFMTGTRGLWWRVFNGQGVKPTIIGDGLEALKDLSINKELRYEIHTALGTRHLLEDENFATASARERQFYTMTVVPDARLIQYAMNEQILHAQGFHLEFEPERLEIFQEDEGEQATAFGDLFEIFSKAMSTEAAFQLAAEKLDYQFTDEQLLLIKKGIGDKKQKDEELAKQMQDNNPIPVQDNKKPPVPPEVVKALVELDKWEDKVTKAGKMVVWHAVDLSPDMCKAIKAGELTFAQARQQLKPMDMLFAPQVKSEAALVLEGIRLALTKQE